MTTTDTALLEALADCLSIDHDLPAALGRLVAVGGPAPAWAERIRRARPGLSLAETLDAAHVLDEPDARLLAVAPDSETRVAVLRALTRRRRRDDVRKRAVLIGLLGPFGVALLTVLLDPLTNLVGGGSYFRPALRGVFMLVLASATLVLGASAVLRRPGSRSLALQVTSRVPGFAWFAGMHAEEEVTSILAGFVRDGQVPAAGVAAAGSAIAWSPLVHGQGFDPWTAKLSLETRLAWVGGNASGHLAERLLTRAQQLTGSLTARVRLATRIGAYGLIFLWSLGSVVSMVSRGLPGMPQLPGAGSSADQKQLEELMKQLEAQ